MITGSLWMHNACTESGENKFGTEMNFPIEFVSSAFKSCLLLSSELPARDSELYQDDLVRAHHLTNTVFHPRIRWGKDRLVRGFMFAEFRWTEFSQVIGQHYKRVRKIDSLITV